MGRDKWRDPSSSILGIVCRDHGACRADPAVCVVVIFILLRGNVLCIIPFPRKPA